MSRRTSLVRRTGTPALGPSEETTQAGALAPDAQEVDGSGTVDLPRDHPRWARDRFTVSAATKALVDHLKPLALRMFGFWDHRMHRLTLDDATIGIDACGLYHCE